MLACDVPVQLAERYFAEEKPAIAVEAAKVPKGHPAMFLASMKSPFQGEDPMVAQVAEEKQAARALKRALAEVLRQKMVARQPFNLCGDHYGPKA